MPTEPEQSSEKPSETEEKQLCVSCVFPNDPEAHFCAKCGAPLSSYAATGPFERIFAEGHVYRQAVERPRRLIVVIGIWMIFGPIGLTAVLLVASDGGPALVLLAILMLAVSLAMIGKTTRNYFGGTKSDENRDA
jgi:hypothetical protein